jgi:hypothetical protein
MTNLGTSLEVSMSEKPTDADLTTGKKPTKAGLKLPRLLGLDPIATVIRRRLLCDTHLRRQARDNPAFALLHLQQTIKLL